MSNSGPAPVANRKSGFGCHASGPGTWNIVVAVSGSPMSPRAMARSAVWMPAPSTVSGAVATRRPLAFADSSTAAADCVVGRDRLLAPDVLAGVDDLLVDLGVRGRDRQVDHDLRRRRGRGARRPMPEAGDAVRPLPGQRRGRAARRRRSGPRRRRTGQVLEVLRGDVAGTDDADPDTAHLSLSLQPGEGLGDALEDVALVRVELDDADRLRSGGEDRGHVDVALAGGGLVLEGALQGLGNDEGALGRGQGGRGCRRRPCRP